MSRDPQDFSPHTPCLCGYERACHSFDERGSWPCSAQNCECEDFEADFESDD